MKLTGPVAISLAGTAFAQNSTLATSTAASPTTTIVSALTTICGSATVLTQNGNYYTCTKAMTLTITDCPCTMTQPFSITTYAAASTTRASTTTIIVPGYCPSTSPTYAQSPAQAQAQAQGACPPSCHGAGASGGPGCTPSIGAATLPAATHGGGYAITNGAGAMTFGGAALAVLVGTVAFFCGRLLM